MVKGGVGGDERERAYHFIAECLISLRVIIVVLTIAQYTRLNRGFTSDDKGGAHVNVTVFFLKVVISKSNLILIEN